MRECAETRPAVAFEPVARAGTGVAVRVVDRGLDGSVRRDDGRGLEVVRGDPLTLHPEHRLGHVREAGVGERPGDVEPRNAVGEHTVGGSDISGAVPVGQVLRVAAVRRRLDLLVRDRREAKGREHRLDGRRRAATYLQKLRLADGFDAAVDLPVALDCQPFVEVVRVVVPAAEGVVAPRHH